MARKIILIAVAAFLLAAVAPISAQQTEDEIVAKFLKKQEQKHFNKIGFVSAYFSYGKLQDDNPYNEYVNFANLNIAPIGGVYDKLSAVKKSNQFGATLGMMLSKRMGFKLGFEYWLKMGTDVIGDYDFDIAPLGEHYDFNLVSEVQVYGANIGVDYYLMNPPDYNGRFQGFALRVCGGAGYYMSQWKLWQGTSSYNLATGATETAVDPQKGSAPALYGGLGCDLPVGFLGLTFGMEAIYTALNFDNLKSYNSLNEELYLTYPNDNAKRLNLDFSGIRGKIELRKFFTW
jgi:hypothetical protein